MQGYSRPPFLGTEVTEIFKQVPLKRPSKRAIVAGGLRVSGLRALLLRLPPWRGALVLSYHRIGDPSASDANRGLWTTAESLHRHLQFLKRRFQILEPEELADASSLSTRGRRVMVSFDDGYRDLYEVAYPVLQANRVHATMFLCSGFIDGRASAWWDEIAWMLRHSELPQLPPGPWSAESLALDEARIEHAIDVATRRYWELPPAAAAQLLEELGSVSGAGRRPASARSADWITWEMAREMQAAGHHIGAHTVTHPILARLAPAHQREEIAGSVERIGAELGRRPRWLAYPVGVAGTFDENTRIAAAAAGIELAFSNYGGRVTRANFLALDVRRVSAETLRTPALFSATLSLPALFARGPG
jgi:peptidoglycan/xylan/chitin deacetylase (PgdA/CDA1 family)